MILGIPKEIKPQEYRVALTPEAVGDLVRAGHRVLVQKEAGRGAGYSDQAFRDNGAVIVSTAAGVWREARLVIKVKEPLPKEYSYFRPDLILFTFLHLASAPVLTKALIKRGVAAVGYETVTAPDGSLPLLRPMSRIAGKLAVLLGAEYLRTDRGEKGILLSHVEGTTPGRVTILGAGNVGSAALEVASGIGARVTIFDRSEERLRGLKNKGMETFLMDSETLSRVLPETDLLIGAVLIPGAKAPKLVTRAMVSRMEKGSVIVDVSVDQGACVETIRPTTHARSTYLYKGIVHYGVTNMPSLVARSATEALVHGSKPYVQRLAAGGFDALRSDPGFGRGLQVYEGKIMHEEVRRALAPKVSDSFHKSISTPLA
jgi:alanine dehydrogenase